MDKKEKIFAFIDSQNLNVTTQKYGWKMDWRKFRQFLTDKYNVEQAYMFIGYMRENEELYKQMHDAGYLVVLKPTFDMTKPMHDKEDDAVERKTKGNVDAELVLWAMKEMPKYNKAIIVSGDGDFFSLIEYLEGKGRLSKILAPAGNYSNLFNQFEKYVDRIDKHRKDLAYKDKRFKRPFSKTSLQNKPKVV